MSEHAVIVHFKYGSTNLKDLHKLEDKLEKEIAKSAVGEYDGNEIAVDGSDGRLYMYGPDADKLFSAIEKTLKKTKFMEGAEVTKRYGSIEENAKETVSTITK